MEEKFVDLSGYRNEIVFLDSIGVKTVLSVAFAIHCFENGVEVEYDNGVVKLCENLSKVRRKGQLSITKSPFLRVIDGIQKQKEVKVSENEMLGIKNLKDYVESSYRFDLSHVLMDCCYSYDQYVNVQSVVNEIPVGVEPAKKKKI